MVAQVSYNDGILIVELEPEAHKGENLFQELFIPIRDALWQLDAETELYRYTQKVVEQVHLLSGYDRVMMYQFDQQWDGEVIAESKSQEMLSYLGNHFPASDIPAQARALYTKNLVRLIADVDATPEYITPSLEPKTGLPLDMTYSALRHLSPIHLQYLRNMGVQATLTISLIQNGKLWGLIACHHTTAKNIPLRARELYEFIGKTVSLKLSNIENNSKTEFYERIRTLLQNITGQIRQTKDIPTVIQAFQSEILGLVRGNGAIISLSGKKYRMGIAPQNDDMVELESWIKANVERSSVFHTDNLDSIKDFAGKYQDIASGMLLAPLDEKLDSYIAWFRAGITRTVKWAGKPSKVITSEHGIPKISPRLSFETWVETFRDKSPAWSQIEIDAAHSLSLSIIEVLTHRALELSEENYRLLAEYSTDMIARFDMGGFYTFVSPSSEALFGVPPGKMIGRSIDHFILYEDRLMFQEERCSLEKSSDIKTIIFRTKKPSGEIAWLEYTIKYVEENGKSEFIVNGRDITQRHNYQLAIEDLHRRNSMILEVSGDGIVTFDPDCKIIYSNAHASQALGYPLEKILGKTCLEVLKPQNHAGIFYSRKDCPLCGSIAAKESIQSSSDYFCRENGTAFPVEYTCTPIEQNGQTNIVLVFKEQPQRQQFDEQMLTNKAIINGASEAIIVTDIDGSITSVNPAFTEITGYLADEVIGKKPSITKSGVHTPNFYRGIWSTLLDKRNWTGEIWNRRKNGEIYPQWGSITPILAKDDNIKNYIGVFSDISKAKQAEEKLYYMANHDVLTGLANRLRFVEHVSDAISLAKRNPHKMLSIAFIDIDRFKIINDTLGHSVGDIYLKTIASRISEVCRDEDFLSRWGGDEFVLCMEGIVDHNQAAEIIKRIMDAVKSPLFVDEHELTPTLSVGISMFPQDGNNTTDLIKYADTAMYLTKERGRNGYVFYTEHLADEAKKKFEIVIELNSALRNNELLLHYQPQVGKGGQIIGVEALVRWQHPQRGLLGPYSFIPLAEELGLIVQVGEWVLNEACRQMAEWLRTGADCGVVAVNIAPAQLKPELVDFVLSMLEKHCLSAKHLELEITEGALERGEKVLPVLHGLRNIGISISIDDFGTGYSSLGHLKHFPITCFKIDKSFIDELPHNPKDTAIVKALLALGDGLEVEVVAEGVERDEQCEFLRSIGASVIQGFYYSTPVKAEQITDIMLNLNGLIKPNKNS
jgi:diguanylate cyclase (GGDEF)-like protein/PAS domain S-box-containing protein